MSRGLSQLTVYASPQYHQRDGLLHESARSAGYCDSSLVVAVWRLHRHLVARTAIATRPLYTEPVTDLGVVTAGVVDRVREMSLVEFMVNDSVFQPPAVGKPRSSNRQLHDHTPKASFDRSLKIVIAHITRAHGL